MKRWRFYVLVAGVLAIGAMPAPADELWVAYEGATSLLLQPDDLAAAGVTVVETDETAPAGDLQELSLGFLVEPGSSLLVAVDAQGVAEFLSGELQHSGGLGLLDNGTPRDVTCFGVIALPGPGRLGVQVIDGVDGLPVFDVNSVSASLDRDAALLTIEGELSLNRDTADAAGNTIRGANVAVGRFVQVLRARAVYGRVVDVEMNGRFVDTQLLPDITVLVPGETDAEAAASPDLADPSAWSAQAIFELLRGFEAPQPTLELMPTPCDPRYPFAVIEAYRQHLLTQPAEPAEPQP